MHTNGRRQVHDGGPISGPRYPSHDRTPAAKAGCGLLALGAVAVGGAGLLLGFVWLAAKVARLGWGE